MLHHFERSVIDELRPVESGGPSELSLIEPAPANLRAARICWCQRGKKPAEERLREGDSAHVYVGLRSEQFARLDEASLVKTSETERVRAATDPRASSQR